MSGFETRYTVSPLHANRISELERKIQRIVEQSFTPSDATRNPNFKTLVEELARLNGRGVIATYQQFNVPLSGELKRQFGIFGNGETRMSRESVRMHRSTPHRRIEISEETEALLANIKKTEPGSDIQEPAPVRHITGEEAERIAAAALLAITQKPATPPKQHTRDQTAAETKLWDSVKSRKPVRTPRTPNGAASNTVTKNRAPRLTPPKEAPTAATRFGTARTAGGEAQEVFLRETSVSVRAFKRKGPPSKAPALERLKALADPAINALVEELTTAGEVARNGGHRAPMGFYSEGLLARVAKLKRLARERGEVVSDLSISREILGFNTSSLGVYMGAYKDGGKELPSLTTPETVRKDKTKTTAAPTVQPFSIQDIARELTDSPEEDMSFERLKTLAATIRAMTDEEPGASLQAPTELSPAPQPKRGPKPKFTEERQKILEMVQKRKTPTEMAEALGMKLQNINYNLRMMGLNDSGKRMKVQLEANPRIREILDELRGMAAPDGNDGRVPNGFYTPELFRLVDELKSIYEIRDDAIAKILNCSANSFKVRRSTQK